MIKIVVGQTGLAVTSSSSSGAGGGGGTYVMKSTYNNDASVLVIAGGVVVAQTLNQIKIKAVFIKDSPVPAEDQLRTVAEEQTVAVEE